MEFKSVQENFNDDTRKNYELWKPFRDINREQVYKVLFKRNFLNFERALLLGAGNGNDIDINFFEDTFQEITIVDIDETALDNLISKAKYPEKFVKRIIDLSGVELQLNQFDFNNKSTSQVETFIRKLSVKHDFTSISGVFDCIVNCNYTSQLVNPFVIKEIVECNIKPSSNLLTLLSELNSKIITNIFEFINSHLHEKGLLIHSTDSFEVSHNEKTNSKSIGFEDIMTALNGDIHNTTPLQDTNVFAKITKYLLVGNYIPSEGFNIESLRFVPWRFSFSDDYVKYYICSVYAFKKGLAVKYNTIKNL